MNTIATFALGPAWTAFGGARSRWAGSARSVLAFLALSAVRGLASMAAAGVFGMIPIAPALNWYAIIGGTVVATLLTLVTLRRCVRPGSGSRQRKSPAARTTETSDQRRRGDRGSDDQAGGPHAR